MRVFPKSRFVKFFTFLLPLAFILLLLQYLQVKMATLEKYHFPRDMDSNQLFPACQQIIKGDKLAIKKANETMMFREKHFISPLDYIKLCSNCTNFTSKRGYILTALSKKEEEFPIAFSITIYKDIEQFERLLKAIYRPQNYYCVHVDKKSPLIFHRAVKQISSCFPNVFVAFKNIYVAWGQFSVLESNLICMEDLLTNAKSWKYIINLSGQEYPLRANNELVEILQKLKGKSIVHGMPVTEERYVIEKIIVYYQFLK